MRFVTVLFWLILFAAHTATAKSYYVSVSGNDTNDGLSVEKAF